MQKIIVGPGDILLRNQDTASSLFLITRGNVRLETQDRAWHLSKDDFFGEEGLFLRRPSFYTAVADKESEIELYEPAEAFHLFKENPALFSRLLGKHLSLLYVREYSCSPLYPGTLECLFILLSAAKEANSETNVLFSLSRLAELLGISSPQTRALLEEALGKIDFFTRNDDLVFEIDFLEIRKKITMLIDVYHSGLKEYFPQGSGRFSLKRILNGNN